MEIRREAALALGQLGPVAASHARIDEHKRVGIPAHCIRCLSCRRPIRPIVDLGLPRACLVKGLKHARLLLHALEIKLVLGFLHEPSPIIWFQPPIGPTWIRTAFQEGRSAPHSA